MTTTQQTPTTIVRATYEAFGRHDIPTVLSLWDPDIEWIECAGSSYAGTYRGAQAVVDGVFAHIPTDFTTFSVVPDEYLESGDVVIALGWYDGVSAGTGRTIHARFAHVVRVTGGLVTHFEAVADSKIVADAHT